MTPQPAVTRDYLRFRLTDAVDGLDAWQAEAFGLLTVERFYALARNLAHTDTRGDHGRVRRMLNRGWWFLEHPHEKDRRSVTVGDLDAIANLMTDARAENAAHLIAAGTVCYHLLRFQQTGDRDCIANLATAAYASFYVNRHEGGVPWSESVPFDEVHLYVQDIDNDRYVQGEVAQQAADLAFVEALEGGLAARFARVLRRGFAERLAVRDAGACNGPVRSAFRETSTSTWH